MNGDQMKRRDTVTVFPGADGQWHWHRKAPNGEIVAHGEAYERRTDALATARRIAGTECHVFVKDSVP